MPKTKYSYKYNGDICRNSNRLYKYGLVNAFDSVIACSATEQGALKEKNYRINLYTRNIAFCEKTGKKEYAANYRELLEDVKKWHLVELEVIEN